MLQFRHLSKYAGEDALGKYACEDALGKYA